MKQHAPLARALEVAAEAVEEREQAARRQALMEIELGELFEPQLRVSAPVNVGTEVLPPLINEFLHRYPEVDLKLELSDRIADLVSDGFDLALRAGPLPDSSLIAHRLAGTRIRVYGSRTYFARQGRPRRVDDLRAHECLTFGAVRGMAWVFGGRGQRELKVRSRLVANNITLLTNAAIAGLGLARLPEHNAETAVLAGQLESVLDEYAPPEVPLHVVHPATRFLAPTVRAFVALLRERLPSKATRSRHPSV